MKTLPLAVLISMFAATSVRAQVAPAGGDDFSSIVTKRTIVVIDNRGNETRGRLLRVTPDLLTLLVGGSPVSVERRDVAAVHERGDSVTNGMLLGLLGGATLGVVGLATDPVGGGDYAQAGASFLVLVGLGVGTAIDALIPGKRLLYERATGPDDFESGDSIKNGLLLGLVIGGVGGFSAGALKDDCDHTPTEGPAYFVPPDCYADEKIAHGSKVGALTGLAGAALGAVIDRMFVGRRRVYRSTRERDPVAIAFAPSISRARMSLSTSVVW